MEKNPVILNLRFKIWYHLNFRDLGGALPTPEGQNGVFGDTSNHHHVLFHPPLINHPTHDHHNPQMRLGNTYTEPSQTLPCTLDLVEVY